MVLSFLSSFFSLAGVAASLSVVLLFRWRPRPLCPFVGEGTVGLAFAIFAMDFEVFGAFAVALAALAFGGGGVVSESSESG